MTTSWELPDNPRRLVRTTEASDRGSARVPTRRGWIAQLLGLGIPVLLLLAGAGFASRYVYLRRLDAKFEKHCRLMREAHQWRELNQVARQWLDVRPRQMQASYFAAQSAIKLNDHEAAVEFLLNAQGDEESTAIALVEAAEVQFSSLNQPVAAVENFEAALRLNPRESLARQRLIFFYALTMQRKKMVEHIRESIRLGLETRENYVFLIGSEWLIFSNGPQYNFLWRTSDKENEHFNVARALGVVANGYVTPPDQAVAAGERPPYLLTGDRGVDPDAPEGAGEREVHYESILRGYLKKYPRNIELLSYFLSKAVASGNAKDCENLLANLPAEALEDGRFWRYKAAWQLMVAKAKPPASDARHELMQKAKESLREARRLNPFDMVSMHLLASIHREFNDLATVDELEAMSSEGSEIRRLVLQSDTARIHEDLFDRLRRFVALCGESEIADAMAKRLELAPIPTDLLGGHLQEAPFR